MKPKSASTSICPAGGAHHWLCYWEGRRYLGTCKKCGAGTEFDAEAVAGPRYTDIVPVGALEYRARREAA